MSIFQANVCFNIFLGLVTGKVWDFTGFCHVDGIWMDGNLYIYIYNFILIIFFIFLIFLVVWSHLESFQAISCLFEPFGAIWNNLETFRAMCSHLEPS